MIVSDLDGTLLRKDKTISDYSIKVLRECQERGIVVAFATARSADASMKLVEKVKPNAVVLNGGALAYADDDIVYNKPMDVEITDELLRLLCTEGESVGCICTETDKGFYINIVIEENDPGWAGYKPIYHPDFKTSVNAKAYKAVAEIFDDKVIGNITSALPGIGVVRFTGEDWVCFADKSVNKLEGIKALADHYGIAIGEVAVFGDDYNDIEMLRSCGIGVAVGNAIDEAKTAADYVCDANESDGPAKWLAENLLSCRE